MYGSMDVEFEVQRTIKRAHRTAFLCHLKKSDWTHQGCKSTSKELQVGCGEDKGNASTPEQAILTCGSKFGKSCIF